MKEVEEAKLQCVQCVSRGLRFRIQLNLGTDACAFRPLSHEYKIRYFMERIPCENRSARWRIISANNNLLLFSSLLLLSVLLKLVKEAFENEDNYGHIFL
jgi:hypothetical protein